VKSRGSANRGRGNEGRKGRVRRKHGTLLLPLILVISLIVLLLLLLYLLLKESYKENRTFVTNVSRNVDKYIELVGILLVELGKEVKESKPIKLHSQHNLEYLFCDI